jgi:hypothetical protein
MKAATTAGANTGVLAAARGQPQRREGAMLAWLLLVDDSDVELLRPQMRNVAKAIAGSMLG